MSAVSSVGVSVSSVSVGAGSGRLFLLTVLMLGTKAIGILAS
jgi:hypothetical protein